MSTGCNKISKNANQIAKRKSQIYQKVLSNKITNETIMIGLW
ncbi:protein of unknown function [Candidatus Nitrosotalea okcheonensis]|uniref:Uncharacterized protein n=1 Tax=Candidatus Nitrosotalea okcheonensis TaxID=1903276 RepID=A0A2H1FF08_9ARCH|nr:protein of unknown function [Candidatus Nitrosotalea okcheonensis]